MNSISAHKLALALLDQNSDQEVFEVGLEENEVVEVTAALQELGCIVTREQFKPTLLVQCPAGIRPKVEAITRRRLSDFR